MGQFYSAGYCPVFVGVNSGRTPLFLGYGSKAGPKISMRPEYTGAFMDLAGTKKPLDESFDGEDALVSIDMSWWNESVYSIIADKGIPKGAGLGSARGTYLPGAVGSLVVTEGLDYHLWVVFSASAKAAYAQGAGGAQPNGMHFWSATLVSDDLNELGPLPKQVHLAWHCRSVINPRVTSPLFPGMPGLTLFDHDMSATVGVPAF